MNATPKPLSQMSADEIMAAVAQRYSEVATQPDPARFNFPVGRKFAESVGYSGELLDTLPSSLWESFTGAGNPQPFVDAKVGETLLDLGCGAGLDLYLYSHAVGERGRIIGLDLSGEMLFKASNNLEESGTMGFELLRAPASDIPLDSGSVDRVTANGIYNLSPDKEAVMREVFRVLKPGGVTVFAEVMLTAPLEEEVRKELKDWFRCIGGALVLEDFLSRMQRTGFERPNVLWQGRNARTNHPLATCCVIRAVKPLSATR